MVQVYISSIYCGKRHNLTNHSTFIVIKMFHKLYVCREQKFIHIKCTEDCQRVDKIKVHIVIENESLFISNILLDAV